MSGKAVRTYLRFHLGARKKLVPEQKEQEKVILLDEHTLSNTSVLTKRLYESTPKKTASFPSSSKPAPVLKLFNRTLKIPLLDILARKRPCRL